MYLFHTILGHIDIFKGLKKPEKPSNYVLEYLVKTGADKETLKKNIENSLELMRILSTFNFERLTAFEGRLGSFGEALTLVKAIELANNS